MNSGPSAHDDVTPRPPADDCDAARGTCGEPSGAPRACGRSFARAALVACAALFLASLLRAHDPGISTAQGELKPGLLVLTTGFAPADVQSLLPPDARTEDRWTEAGFDVVHAQLDAIAPQLWDVRAGQTPLRPREARVELLPSDSVSFRLVYPLPQDATTLTLRAAKIPELPPGHRQFLIVSDERGFAIAKKLLSMRDLGLEVSLPGAAAGAVTTQPVVDEAPTALGFVKLGVEHIWTGYDHLLFLFALLVVCGSFRSIVAIISCFTLAHSLTLALATLDVVNLPARWVEPAIAASIVFVGVENLIRRGSEPRGRWALTFAFGLIHGFGFASVLRDLGVGGGARQIAVPLVTFNLGVELGQVAIAALVLPVVWQLRRNDAFVRRGVPALSAIVAAAGVYWLVQRTMFV